MISSLVSPACKLCFAEPAKMFRIDYWVDDYGYSTLEYRLCPTCRDYLLSKIFDGIAHIESNRRLQGDKTSE